MGSHLLPSPRLLDLAYNPIIAVHSSAFLMTLNRKGLIRHYTHAIWYTGALMLAHFHMHHLMIEAHPYFWYQIIAAFIART